MSLEDAKQNPGAEKQTPEELQNNTNIGGGGVNPPKETLPIILRKNGINNSLIRRKTSMILTTKITCKNQKIYCST